MEQVIVSVTISADEYIRYYQGSAQSVIATSLDGRAVSFPASLLRPYLTHEGIQGRFKLTYDQHYKFQSIEKL